MAQWSSSRWVDACYNDAVNYPIDQRQPMDDAAERDALQQASLALLDFDAIRARLAGHATFYEARAMALSITPSVDPHEVARLQRETADARSLLDEIGDLSLSSDADTSQSVTRAELGGALTGGELLAIAGTLEVHRRLRRALAGAASVAPLMAELGGLVPDLRELQRQIRAKIGQRGEVVDDATPTLRALRSQVRDAYERVTDSLQRFIESDAARDSLQDPVISVRADRLVVPVKAERRRRVAGIVHDASNTGATVFVEPFSTVELCNEWRELALEEEREVARVLRDLSELVGGVAQDIRGANETTAKVDFALARARYALSLGASAPVPVSGGQRLRLIRARHPLLGRDAVPLTVSVGPDWRALVITGPNTGGKTVAMKTVGIAALMHQCGLQIAADEGSALPVFDGVFADIGDQQSIAESVSTFGSHIRSLVRILRHAAADSLVLLDEIGASTDPEEGSALAKSILAHLADTGVSTIATTHHRSVAAFAETSPRMANASFELDPDTLEPTYEITIGAPGRSYAMAVAERLGLPASVLERARSLMEPRHLLFEDWLSELQRERQRLQASVENAERDRAEAESLRRELVEQLEYIVSHRDDMLDAARRDIARRTRDASRKLDSVEASLDWGAPAESASAAARRVRRVRQRLAAVEPPQPAPARPPALAARPLSVGDTVFVRGMGLSGRIVSMDSHTEEVEVAIGRVRVSVELHRLSRIERESADGADESPDPSPAYSARLAPALASDELDIRGRRAADAEIELEEFLDHAMRDGLSKVRVIHGRGTGALRNMVRERLRRHRSVGDFGQEPRERGGSGATWAEMI